MATKRASENSTTRSERRSPADRSCLRPAVDALPLEVKMPVMGRVMTFSDFTPDNDPHGEHDFGSFELAGHKFFFKIDYYDREPRIWVRTIQADPAKTTRVLTIMLAEEY